MEIIILLTECSISVPIFFLVVIIEHWAILILRDNRHSPKPRKRQNRRIWEMYHIIQHFQKIYFQILVNGFFFCFFLFFFNSLWTPFKKVHKGACTALQEFVTAYLF